MNLCSVIICIDAEYAPELQKHISRCHEIFEYDAAIEILLNV